MGHNLQDHVAFEGLSFVYNATDDPMARHHSHDDYIRFLRDASGPLTSNGLELLGFLKTNRSKEKSKYPDIELLMRREANIPGKI